MVQRKKKMTQKPSDPNFAEPLPRAKLGILSDDAELIAQINEQQYEYLQPKTAREHIHLKFWHPPRRHDDQLFALALACYASREEESTLIIVPMS